MTVLAPITRMPEVGALLEKLPDLTVVIDHMADCPVDQPDGTGEADRARNATPTCS